MLVKHLIFTLELDRSQIIGLLDRARSLSRYPNDYVLPATLNGKVLALVFYTESMRTKLSFETAMMKLGGRCISFFGTNPGPGQGRPVEPMRDIARIISYYSDICVLRHPAAKSGAVFAENATVPIISGGTGLGRSAEHPTQALTDIALIHRTFGTIDGLTILMIGDLDRRTCRSLLLALTNFKNISVLLCATKDHELFPDDFQTISMSVQSIHYVSSVGAAIADVDVVYHCGFDPAIGNEGSDYRLNAAITATMREHAIVMHALPRTRWEIAFDVDDTSRARYFEQSALGVSVRMAILESFLTIAAGTAK